MVVLNKIYTRTGDAGDTALGDGTRVAKHDARVTAYGTSDELNSFVGVARLAACQSAPSIRVAPQLTTSRQRPTLISNDRQPAWAECE